MGARGMPTVGPQVIPTARGVLGHGLAIGGTAAVSTVAALTTTKQKITFNADSWTQDGMEKQAVEVRFKAIGSTLLLHLGDIAAVSTYADGTWTGWYACADLQEGVVSWWASSAATPTLEYEIRYV